MLDRSRENSKDEHMHLSDAVLESVMVFRLGAGAVAEVVVALCLAKAGYYIYYTVLYTRGYYSTVLYVCRCVILY